MTDKEILLGKRLYARINAVYESHPEYIVLNKKQNRYEKFVNDMTEKYGCTRENIVKQIHRSREGGYYD